MYMDGGVAQMCRLDELAAFKCICAQHMQLRQVSMALRLCIFLFVFHLPCFIDVFEMRFVGSKLQLYWLY